jgi:hypothetical protein
MVLLFWTFHLLPLADGVAIGFATGPLFVSLFAILLLREPVSIKRWMAIMAGFLGVLVMVTPAGHSLAPFGVAVALASAVCFGLAMTGVRALGSTEKPITTAFYFALAATLMTAAMLPWGWVTPNSRDLLLLLMVGACGGIGPVSLIPHRLINALPVQQARVCRVNISKSKTSASIIVSKRWTPACLTLCCRNGRLTGKDSTPLNQTKLSWQSPSVSRQIYQATLRLQRCIVQLETPGREAQSRPLPHGKDIAWQTVRPHEAHRKDNSRSSHQLQRLSD